MAKRVNNIAYKGINHSPSLVSDNDGHASECVNLSPDYNDLKPMPMPVKREGYHIETGHSLVFVHQGIGYENYVEIDETHTRLVFKDAEGNILYYVDGDNDYWTNESEILAIEAMGNTVIVSTKDGVEYIIFQPDVPVTGQTSGGSYKPIGQRPPMPVLQFSLRSDASRKFEEIKRLEYESESEYPKAKDNNDNSTIYIENNSSKLLKMDEVIQGLVSKMEKDAAEECYFFSPFFVRYAIRMKNSDYIMQSAPVLMLPSTDKCPIAVELLLSYNDEFWPWNPEYTFVSSVLTQMMGYRLVADYVSGASIINALKDWKDIVYSIDVFVSQPIENYRKEDWNGLRETTANVYFDSDLQVSLPAFEIPYATTYDMGICYRDGIIKQINSLFNTSGAYELPSRDSKIINKDIERTALFHKFCSINFDELEDVDGLELVSDTIANLATLPTLEDDYFTHNAVSPSLLQVYNSRLNMANISQKVFKGFVNGMQPQSADGYTHPSGSGLVNYYVYRVWFKVKKNGRTYIVTPYNDEERLDYTSYLYYPDPDCYEAVVVWSTGVMVAYYYTMPMKRHETLNGAYWYDDMKCLAQYLYDNDAINNQEASMPIPTPDTDLWFDIPNRFMMSSVGNPWHFPIGNQFDIGRREIRALSLNAENMNAPQYGQNPIYVFSSDGIWTLSINADGTAGKPSYVSGDVVSEMATLGSSPTASGAQVVFFKTSRGISAIVGSAVKEIDLVMKGRLFNPRTMLLPQGSIVDGVPTAGFNSYWLDVIFKSCDSLPYADFARQSNLLYDYRNNRLLLYNKYVDYMYVYDIRHDFWSKMLPLVVDESGASPAQEEYNTRSNVSTLTHFNGTVMVGNNAILTDTDGYLWDVGWQPDENDIKGRFFGLYVSRPLRFGTDDMKTLSRIVHDYQVTNEEYLVSDPNPESVKMALYGSRNGKDYYQIKTLRGTAYKFYIIALYTQMLASSRYAYTAFEWEARMTDKIR